MFFATRALKEKITIYKYLNNMLRKDTILIVCFSFVLFVYLIF